MRSAQRCLGALAAWAAFLAAPGCGGEKPANEAAAEQSGATVSGKVTIKGHAASKARVTFEPLDSRGMPITSHVAELGKDGTYKVTTSTGKNDITVSSTGDAAIDSSYNKTTIDAKPGPNTLDLDLPLKQ